MKTHYSPAIAFLGIFSLFMSVIPGAAAMRKDKLKEIDTAIMASIGAGEIPGACLWIESKGEVYKRAYGLRMKSPQMEPMKLNTIFDIASLT